MKTFLRTLLLAVSAITCAFTANASDSDKTVNMALFWLDGDVEPTSGWNGWTLSRCGVGENLVQIDENLKFKPMIASSWKQLDELTTEFTIREGVVFHNGEKVDAAAVKASLERVANITDRKDLELPIESIQADGMRLVVTLKYPYATLLNELADPLYTIIDANAAQGNDNFRFQPIATGAFKVESFNAETGLVLKKHAEYWNGEPSIETINVKYIQDAAARSMALQSGELDLATQISPMDLKILQNDPKLNVLTGPNLRIFFLRTNFDHPWMQVPQFRQAIRHAIRKDVYAERIAGGIPARGPFTELLPFGLGGDDVYAYDLDKAKSLLDQAGIKDTNGDGFREFEGKKLTLKYVSMTHHGAVAKNIGIAMQSELKKVGIDVEVLQMENHVEVAKQGQFDFIYERWTSAPTLDPQYFLESSFKTGARGNVGGYSNPELDALLAKLERVTDKEQRNELGKQGSKLLMEDAAGIFLFYQQGNLVHNKRIEGIYKFISEIYYVDDRIKLAE
ncbi:ABC transporter substrate-binding protein [Vibrio sp. SCSIO 43136]|uniref:ABC transporter substrate-binding protein n=1 Tax=Vibrio sp. SCSIO 43136 TaxID=2819101 RepID=UPI0020750111|nr:ABC transporter substrate-binding protein [Vibrio sp. SCSIO 43136]USD64284.1 ABC transporter substrate-binding protein [Vibrio sp. SCSIO 43136]